MAVDLIVRLVERYLAEFRALFREHEDCGRALPEILDVFVQAGWPRLRERLPCLHGVTLSLNS